MANDRRQPPRSWSSRFPIVHAVTCTVLCVGVMPFAGVSAQDRNVAAAERTPSTVRYVTVDMVNRPLVSAIHAIARQARLEVAYERALLPVGLTVTVRVKDAPVEDAFAAVLRGTRLTAHVQATGQVVITRDSGAQGSGQSSAQGVAPGAIAGTVTDAATKRGLEGVVVVLDGVSRGVTTGTNGRFRIDGVQSGEHRITARKVGYGRLSRAVTVSDDAMTTVELVLSASANTLDQVVVTGTVIPTELKAVPNAITVITAKQIEERGITQIQQLFRGDVPGLFAQNRGSFASLDAVNMFSRGATGLDVTTNPIKTYIDGVEMADPKYLSQIDPRSIERIEILTGPQASTIYGSNALNGVMQVFTKRGTSNTTQLTLNLLSGWVENNFSNAHTPQHDYSAQVSGVEGRLSYNASGAWNYVGPWTPAKQTTRTSASGGTRLTLPTRVGPVTADITLRRSITQTQQRGTPYQRQTGYQETGWYNVPSGAGLTQPTTWTLNGQTLGLTLEYAPTTWWSQEFGVGQDAAETEQRETAPRNAFPGDTALLLDNLRNARRSLRFTTTVRVPVTSLVQTTVTTGADAWQNISMHSIFFEPPALTGVLTGYAFHFRQPGHNTGAFMQTQIGVRDRLFVTYGLRVEWNPTFGAAAQPNYAPRYGVAYTQEAGAITAKLRASFGRATRPPAPGLALALKAASVGYGPGTLQDYGNYDYFLANPSLTPEHQQGGEGGLELYLGQRGSLVVTRFQQTVDALISGYKADSARSHTTTLVSFGDSYDADGYGYMYEYRNVNLGSIRNQGWELQGSVNTGPLTTKGTYSWTKSRTLGVDAKYRAFFPAQDYPQYQPGATFRLLPEHTWALGVTYAQARTTMALNVTGTGQLTSNGNDFRLRSLDVSSIRLFQNALRMNSARYIDVNPSYSMADVTATHRFSDWAEGILQIQNITDRYTNDYGAVFATIGRQGKAGFRIRLQ